MNIVSFTGDMALAGRIVYWRSHHAGADAVRLEVALRGIGFTNTPPPQTQEQALKYAVEMHAPRGSIIRPLAKPLVGFGVMVQEFGDDGRPQASTQEDAVLQDGVLATTMDAIKAAEVENTFNLAKHSVSAQDLSRFLTDRVTKMCKGTPLPGAVGAYFVPASNVERWSDIADAVKNASQYTFFTIPALHSGDVADAVLAAIRKHYDESVAEIEEAIEKFVDSKKSMNAQLRKVEALRDHLSHYAQILGPHFASFEDGITKLDTRIGDALAAIEAAKQAASAPPIASGPSFSTANLKAALDNVLSPPAFVPSLPDIPGAKPSAVVNPAADGFFGDDEPPAIVTPPPAPAVDDFDFYGDL